MITLAWDLWPSFVNVVLLFDTSKTTGLFRIHFIDEIGKFEAS